MQTAVFFSARAITVGVGQPVVIIFWPWTTALQETITAIADGSTTEWGFSGWVHLSLVVDVHVVLWH